jgi:hypothetical protein
MKFLLIVIILTLLITDETKCQTFFASSRKSFNQSRNILKEKILSAENQQEKSFFLEIDSVDFNLDLPKIANKIHRDSVYNVVEENAYFLGSETEMYDYIYKNIAKNHKKKGVTVVIKLIVENFGGISHPHVLSCGNDEKLANDILKLVKTMKVWTPGKILGFDVSSHYIITVKF